MSSIRLTFQDGHTETHPMGDGQLLIRLEPSGGIATDCYAGGTYSASELKSVTLPDWVAIAPPPTGMARLKEVEHDLSVYDTDGRRWGPKRTFTSQAWDDSPEPEPVKRKLRKIHAPEEAA